MGHVYFTYMNGSFFMVHVGKYTIVPWIPWTMLVGSRLFFLSNWYLFRWHVKTCLGTKEVGWRCASIEHRWHSIFCEYIETKQTNMTKKLKKNEAISLWSCCGFLLSRPICILVLPGTLASLHKPPGSGFEIADEPSCKASDSQFAS